MWTKSSSYGSWLWCYRFIYPQCWSEAQHTPEPNTRSIGPLSVCHLLAAQDRCAALLQSRRACSWGHRPRWADCHNWCTWIPDASRSYCFLYFSNIHSIPIVSYTSQTYTLLLRNIRQQGEIIVKTTAESVTVLSSYIEGVTSRLASRWILLPRQLQLQCFSTANRVTFHLSTHVRQCNNLCDLQIFFFLHLIARGTLFYAPVQVQPPYTCLTSGKQTYLKMKAIWHLQQDFSEIECYLVHETHNLFLPPSKRVHVSIPPSNILCFTNRFNSRAFS